MFCELLASQLKKFDLPDETDNPKENQSMQALQ